MGSRDPTFRNYTSTAAASYAVHRGAYPDALINMVIDHHTSSGGQLDLLLDVGCGPGSATRQVAPSFKHTIGADPGESMIQKARTISSGAKTSNIEYHICAAEDIASLVEPETVDLITAATAAHWFDLPEFYVAAAKVLKPGGSIIMWCSGQYFVDPETTPNAEKVQALFYELHHETLRPYEVPGNRHSRELYANLDMPWEIAAADEGMRMALNVFEKEASRRETVNENGVKDERFEHGYLQRQVGTLEHMKMALGTVSQVARWREAHTAQLESREVEDCVDNMARLVKDAVEEVPGGESKEYFAGCSEMVMILIKNRKRAG